MQEFVLHQCPEARVPFCGCTTARVVVRYAHLGEDDCVAGYYLLFPYEEGDKKIPSAALPLKKMTITESVIIVAPKRNR